MQIVSPLTGDVGNPMVTEAFLESHLYRLPITAVAPLAKVNTIQKIFGEHAKTVVAAAVSKRSDTVANMKTPLEKEGTHPIVRNLSTPLGGYA